MQYNNLTDMLSESVDTRRYFLNLPLDIQLELHKFNDNVRTGHELRNMAESLNRKKRRQALENYPHEYSLY